jgi:hypothetical protein
MSAMEPERAPAGILETKYNPVIGFKQFTEGESGRERDSIKGKRRNNSNDNHNSSLGSDY